FSVVKSLPAPGAAGAGMKWLRQVFPLRVAVEAGNRPPMAKQDLVEAASLKPDSNGKPTTVIDVLANDKDADLDPLTIVSIGTPEHGTADFDFLSQTITYTANSAVVENDTFAYTIVDGSGGSATGRVRI